MAVKVTVTGNFNNTEKFLNKLKGKSYLNDLDSLAQEGVSALRAATPVRSGATAAAWSYHIERSGNKTSIIWDNSNIHEGVNIAVILQYGHGTRRGGYVSGRDYINPAIQPVFDDIADRAWKAVTSL